MKYRYLITVLYSIIEKSLLKDKYKHHLDKMRSLAINLTKNKALMDKNGLKSEDCLRFVRLLVNL